jgi:hypothetical protein
MKIVTARSVYHDNLAGARARGTAHTGDGHGSPVVTSEAKRIASKLLDDPIYRVKLLRRLRNGEAGALEVWLWRWKLGDPPRAEQATEEADKSRFEALRAEVRSMIQSGEHVDLEAQILGPLPARRALPPGEPVAAADEGLNLDDIERLERELDDA